MLETCCFDFGHRWVPDLMKEKRWRELESLELTQWIQWFSTAKNTLPATILRQIEGKSVAEILSAVGVIRHAAVHRIRTSAEEILNMLGAAETFANMLYNESKMKAIQQIKIKLNGRLEEFWRNRTMVRRKLTKGLRDIARRRLELDDLEEEWIEDYRVADEEHRNEAGAAIEAHLNDPQKFWKPFDKVEKGEYSDGSESVQQESLNAPNEDTADGVMLSSFDASLQ